MEQLINQVLIALNKIGAKFCNYAAGTFVQSSILIMLLLIIDLVLQRRVRAIFRYYVWLLVFVKLILPPSFSLPTGIGYWWSGHLAVETPIVQQVSNVVQPEPANVAVLKDFAISTEIPQFESSEVIPKTAVQDVPKVSSSSPLTWQAVVFILWLIGVLLFFVLLVQRVFFVRALIAQSSPAKGRSLDMMQRCRRQVGIGYNVGLKLSNNIQSPAVCGLARPIVLIPKALLEKLSLEKLRAVLVHELAHIKRGDLWVNLAQTILQVIYFYNPFVWLANTVVRRIREQAVDEMVLVALGAEAKSYGSTLIDIAEMAFWRTNLSLRLISVAESKKSLHRRIKHMLNRPIPTSAKLSVAGAFAVIIVGAMLLPMAGAASKEKEKPRFMAALPNSITVELVGVCEHPIEGKKWWRPDGELLEKAPYASRKGEAISNKNEELNRLAELAVRVSRANLQDMGLRCKIPGATRTSINSGIEQDASGTLKSIACEISKLISRGEVHIGVAADSWQTIATQRSNLDKLVEDKVEGGFVTWDVPSEEEGNAVIKVAHLFGEYDCRIVAEDRNGNILKACGSSGGGADALRTIKYTFPVNLSGISKFLFQTRTYQWIAFKDISLQPGLKTDVQIEIEGASEVSDEDKMASENLAAEGWALWRQRKLAEAEKVFEKAVLKDTTNANAWNGLGWSQQNQGKSLNAKVSFEKCLQIQPKHAAALNGLGWIAKAQGKTDEAIGRWKKAIEAAPTATAALNGLATTYMELKDYDKAEKYYKMWLKVEPDNANAKAGLEKAKLTKTNGQAERKEQSNSILPKEVQPSEKIRSGRFKSVVNETEAELIKQMGDVTEALIQAFNEGDISTTLSYYTEDGMSLPDQHEAAMGKGALHKLQLEARDEKAKIHSIRGVEQQVWICGDFIFEAGRCMLSFKSPKLRFLLSDWRKYLTIWTRQTDGSLKIKLDCWNLDVIPIAESTSDSVDPVVIVVPNEISSSLSSDDSMAVIYKQIKQNEANFHKAFVECDDKAAVQFYADDAVLIPWRYDIVRGKAAIIKYIRKSMDESPLVDMTQHVVHVEGNNQMLFAVNLFSWTFKDKSSAKDVTFSGKGVHVWKRCQNDSWKILLDLYNVSVPVPEK
jgi:beta-lactamase regulating signal transducer with metallopeptidase domain/ketosteroid isomerase-like protein/Tfp pilus assembly protein PilF